MTVTFDEIVVREGHVKGVELRDEASRQKPGALERVVIASKVMFPVWVPGACGIGGGVSRRRAFSDPEYRSPNLVMPRTAFDLPRRRGLINDLGDPRSEIGIVPC